MERQTPYSTCQDAEPAGVLTGDEIVPRSAAGSKPLSPGGRSLLVEPGRRVAAHCWVGVPCGDVKMESGQR